MACLSTGSNPINEKRNDVTHIDKTELNRTFKQNCMKNQSLNDTKSACDGRKMSTHKNIKSTKKKILFFCCRMKIFPKQI